MASVSTDLVPGLTTVPGLLNMDPDANVTAIEELIHPYWKQWDIEHMIPDSWHYMVAAWMTFFGILGTLGNLLIIWIFLRTKSLRTPPNFLLVNLAISDMSFSAINGFPLLTISAINKRWAWGKLFCEIYGFAGGIFGLMSINNLAWIAYDRYMVISNPLGASQKMTKKRSMTILLVVWLWSALWSVPPFMGWGAYVPEGFQTSCTFDYLTHTMNNYTFVIGMYFFGFIMPVFIIMFCYAGIYSSVKAHHAEMRKTAERMGAKAMDSDKDKNAEIQVAKVGFISISTFMLSWCPYAVVGAIGMLYPYEAMMIHPLLSECTVMAAKASAAYNPIIYALSHPKFRTEVDKHFPWLLACCKPKAKPVTSSRAKSDREQSSVSQVTETVEMSQAQTPDAAPAVNPSATV